MITAIASLANEHAIDDLKILFFTLALWNKVPPTIYLFTDTKTAPLIKKIPYPGRIVMKEDKLNPYATLNRKQMESRPGTHFKTLFADFTAEKTDLMEWALSEEPDGVLFCDADICHLGPLPEIPDGVDLALSPHMIRPQDTARFGIYNAGFLWFKNPTLPGKWKELCKTSRFFEQGCLDDLAQGYSLYEFPVQNNYGWWRLWQGTEPPPVLLERWGILRSTETAGIAVEKSPLLSVHTHWYEKNDQATHQFNMMVLSYLKKLAPYQSKTKKLVTFLETIA